MKKTKEWTLTDFNKDLKHITKTLNDSIKELLERYPSISDVTVDSDSITYVNGHKDYSFSINAEFWGSK